MEKRTIEPSPRISLETIKQNLKGDQAEAFDAIRLFIDQPVGGMFLLDGYAGTGKTYLMNVVIDYVKDTSKRSVLVTAPTHKAVKVIRQHVHNSTVEFSTIHSALGLKEEIDGHGRIHFVKDKYAKCKLEYGIQFLIVDETSMLADELYEEIKIYASRGLKVLFVGDSLQIPPVSKPDAIPFDRHLREQEGIGHIKMNEIIRQEAGNPIIDHSFKIRENIRRPIPAPDRDNKRTKQGSVSFIHASQADAFIQDKILSEYSSDAFKADIDHVKILAWRNKTVDKYNDMIRTHIYGQEALAKILPGERLIAMEPLMEENRVMIHNSEEMEVLGHKIETTNISDVDLKFYSAHVNVIRDDDPYTEFIVRIIHEDSEKDLKDLLDLYVQYCKSLPQGYGPARQAWGEFYQLKRTFFWVRYSYAITCHKSQGSTYNIAVVYESDIDANHDIYEKNRILYTACTRPRKDLYVIY